MNTENDTPGGAPASAAPDAVAIGVGGLFWSVGLWLFVRAEHLGGGAEEGVPLLAPIVLMMAVGTVLLAAGLCGLCRWPGRRQSRR